ncbi:MAG: LD-carboxypeptidase [Bdellovibrionales bacterium]|nr:LD-carboxypeptidase [Bdellovibrionales bacterium]
MQLLPSLCKGDKVGVWTASDPIVNTPASQWVERGAKTLKQMGFTVVNGATLNTQTKYTAGTAELRWKDFSSFIKDPDIKLILTALGGENAHQILPLIDFELIARNPKIIMGYSDPTVFLNPITQFSKIPTFYGHHLASFDPEWPWFGDYDRDCFERIFIKAEHPFEVPPSNNRECWREGVSEGRLVGVFNRITGMILGKFYHSESPQNYDQTLKAIILDITSDFKFPILKTVDFGHFSHFCPLPLGVMCRIDATQKLFKILDPVIQKT